MELAAFNSKWQKRFAEFAAWSPTPMWALGLAPSPESRYWHERYLPVREYCRNLACLLRPALPHHDWGPTCLRSPQFLAITDFWRALPPAFAGRLSWQQEELLPLACALAAPPRFGTSAGRYPEQICELRKLKGALLDLGCGTGEGTAEFAELGFACTGVTLEPLEAWMARHRFPDLEFVAADVRKLCLLQKFDVVVCNGLIGGPMLHKDAEFATLIAVMQAALKPAGVVAIADRFHAGRAQRRERFVEMAKAAGLPLQPPV